MKYTIVSAAIILSLSFSLTVYAEEKGFFSTMFNDLKSSGVEGVLERKKIREWYKKNKGKLIIVDGSETIGCKKAELFDLYDCNFKAEIINQTDDELTGLILNFKVYNKSNNALVTEEIEALPISIYPTVKKSINIEFTSSKMGNARSQLAENFSWNYDLVAYLPDHLHEKDFSNNFKGKTYGYEWLAE